MDPLELRTARADDAPLLSLLAISVYVQTYATRGLRPILGREALGSFDVPAWQATLGRADTEIVVAGHAGHVVGFAQFARRARHPNVAIEDGAELERLYVLERFTHRGVGRRLLAEVERRAAEGLARALWLTAWIGNPRALQFYAACGYEAAGSWPYRFEDETFENRVFFKRLRP